MAYRTPSRGLGQLRTSLAPSGVYASPGGYAAPPGGSAGATVLEQTSPCGYYVTQAGPGGFPVRAWVAQPCPPPPTYAPPPPPPPPVMVQTQTNIQETRVIPTQVAATTVQVAGGDIAGGSGGGYQQPPQIIIMQPPPVAPAPIIPPMAPTPWVMPPGPEPVPFLGPDGQWYADPWAPAPIAPGTPYAPAPFATGIPAADPMRPGGVTDPYAPMVTTGAAGPVAPAGFDVTAIMASVPWWAWGLLAAAGVFAWSKREPKTVVVKT